MVRQKSTVVGDHMVRGPGVRACGGVVVMVTAEYLVCRKVEDAISVDHEGAGGKLGRCGTAGYDGRGAGSYGGATTFHYTSKGWVSTRFRIVSFISILLIFLCCIYLDSERNSASSPLLEESALSV